MQLSGSPVGSLTAASPSKPSSSPLRVDGATGRSRVGGRRIAAEAPPLAPPPAPLAAPGPAPANGSARQMASPSGKTPHGLLLSDMQANPHCSINTDGEAALEIRTKVFRIGAPLLRSTIPVSLGRSPSGGYGGGGYGGGGYGAPKVHSASMEDEDEDVETVLSLSDEEFEDMGALSVTLDFPC